MTTEFHLKNPALLPNHLKEARRIKLYKEQLEALNSRWYPHSGQHQALKAFFSKPTKNFIFIQAGRNWGKTNFAMYLAWRFAALLDNQSVYFIGAEKKQQKEIIWEPKGGQLSIKNFGGETFKPSANETELRLEFPNGSFVKVDGSDNAESYRGIPFDLMIFDEWKDHRYEFYQAVYPSRFKKKGAKIVIIGTPPDNEDHHYVRHVEEIRNDPDWVYIEGSCWDNPHIDHDELRKEKQKYYARGDGALWEREYEAKFVFGGSSSIFPMWDRKFIHAHDTLLELLRRDRNKLRWFSVFDPGSTSCFAALFGCINPYTSELFLLDEIYEKDHSKTSSTQIFQRAKGIESALWPDHPKGTFKRVYDEAARWFANEIAQNFREGMSPTQKARTDKESQISLIKDVLLHERVYVSEKCKNLVWEIRNYKTDEKGKVKKENDHLIDCLRYALAHFNYRFIEGVHRPKVEPNIRTPQQALRYWKDDTDWTAFADDPLFN